MAVLKARPKGVRWGHLQEIRHIKRIGTGPWKSLPNRLKHLTAWRRQHMTGLGHISVRMYGTRHGVRPSSNLRLRGKTSKLDYIKKKGL